MKEIRDKYIKMLIAYSVILFIYLALRIFILGFVWSSYIIIPALILLIAKLVHLVYLYTD